MVKVKHTKVGIIGCGPAGLLLSHLLHQNGIPSIAIDNKNQTYIEGRVRAGVLEWASVETLREAGLSARMDREGLPHNGVTLAYEGDYHRLDFKDLIDKKVMVYGQTELTKDLFKQRLKDHAELFFDVCDVTLNGVKSDKPSISFLKDNEPYRIECDYIAGCDGFHGPSRRAIPDDILNIYERVYPFGWLGILTEQPPVSDELIYANHHRGFALCSMRSATRSRYFVQCSLNDRLEDWPDERFWEELSLRIGQKAAGNLNIGASFEKSLTPLRSFVAEPLRYGALFLAGDAAHIVPPTGAKGLNLAIADIKVLANALSMFYKKGDTSYLENYSERRLKHIWKVERFSWYLSTLMHQFPEKSRFEQKIQRAEFDYIMESETASRAIAENYTGLPFDY